MYSPGINAVGLTQQSATNPANILLMNVLNLFLHIQHLLPYCDPGCNFRMRLSVHFGLLCVVPCWSLATASVHQGMSQCLSFVTKFRPQFLRTKNFEDLFLEENYKLCKSMPKTFERWWLLQKITDGSKGFWRANIIMSNIYLFFTHWYLNTQESNFTMCTVFNFSEKHLRVGFPQPMKGKSSYLANQILYCLYIC